MTSDRKLTSAFLLLVGAFLVGSMGTTLLGRQVFLGADIVVSNDPWRSELPTRAEPANPCLGDTVDAVLPSRAEFRRRFYDGDFALWNPLGPGGEPLGSVPNAGVASPLNLPYLALPLWLAPTVSKLAELAISLGFTFLFLRRIGLSRPSSVLGGLVFSTSGFVVVWTNWSQSHVAALIPALFWAGERYLQLRSIRSLLPIALTAAVMLAEGFPSVTGYAVLAWIAYVTLRARLIGKTTKTSTHRVVIGGASALALGAGLIAFQLLPFLSGLESVAGPRRQTAADHLPFSSLISLGLPRAFGSEPTCYTIETSAFIGVGALMLIVVALAWWRNPVLPRGVFGYFASATAVSIVLGWVGGAPLAFAQHIPVFSINNVGRIRSLLGFLLSVLAAIGFETILRRNGTGRHARLRTRLAASVTTAALVCSVLEVQRKASSGKDLDHLGRELAIGLGLASIAACCAYAAFRLKGHGRQVAAVGIGVVIAAQGTAFAHWFWPRINRDLFYPKTTTHQFLHRHLGSHRFGAAGFTMTPGTATYYGLRAVTGRAFTDAAWGELLFEADAGVFRSRTYTALNAPAVQSPVLDRLAVRYFVTSNDEQPFGQIEPAAEATASTLLRSPVPLETTMPPGAAIRAVGITLVTDVTLKKPLPRIDVSVINDAGTVVAAGFRRLLQPVPAGPLFVPVAPEVPASASRLRARITVQDEGGEEVALPVAADLGGAPCLTIVRGEDDGLKLVFAAGATIWERHRALPRFRWASNSRVVTDRKERVELLASGDLKPTEVVLEAPAPPPGGEGATIQVQADSGDVIRLKAEARAPGFVVVADALQRGWVATLNGERVPLRPADHALVAVAVPAGDHDLVLSYSPPRFRLGLVISLLSLTTLLVIWHAGSPRRTFNAVLRRSSGQSL